MKVLIWIGTFIGISCLDVLIFRVILGLDFVIGGLLFYVIWFFLARWLCKKWDMRSGKGGLYKGSLDMQGIILLIPGAYVRELEDARGDKAKVTKITDTIISRGIVSRLYKDQIVEEYSKPAQTDSGE